MRRLLDIGVLGQDTTWLTSSGRPMRTSTSSCRRVRSHRTTLAPIFGLALASRVFATFSSVGGTSALEPMGLALPIVRISSTRSRLAALLQRRPMELASGRLSSETLLRSAARSGARGVRFEEQLGSLTPGKDADLLVLATSESSGREPAMRSQTARHVIIDRADSSDLETVLIRGRAVMRDGRITLVDEEQVRRNFADAAANRLWRYATSNSNAGPSSFPASSSPSFSSFYERWTQASPSRPATNTTRRRGPCRGRRLSSRETALI